MEPGFQLFHHLGISFKELDELAEISPMAWIWRVIGRIHLRMRGKELGVVKTSWGGLVATEVAPQTVRLTGGGAMVISCSIPRVWIRGFGAAARSDTVVQRPRRVAFSARRRIEAPAPLS